MSAATEFTFYDPSLAASLADAKEELISSMRQRWQWETIACLFCGEEVASDVATEKDGITVRRCVVCGHLFVSPRLPEAAVADLYSQSYWDVYQRSIGSPALSERIAFDYRNGFGKLRRDVLPYRSSGRLLDIGASNGGTVRAARETGFAADGIEPSAEIVALAKQAHGFDLLCGNLLDFALPAWSRDIITLHDVLEHLFQPLDVLRECWRILAPGGMIVIETPTTDSLDFAREGDDWSHMSPLEHVHLFSEHNLVRAVTQCGFDIIDVYCPHENNVIVIGTRR